jgi:diadenylate cyclase
VYKGVKLIRETRAQQLLKGIILLAVSFALVKILQLNAMTFLLEKVLDIGIIAVIVLFQPEMRRALEKVGRTQVRNLGVFGIGFEHYEKSEKEWGESIEIISAAVQNLSKTSTGALIVIERQTKLGEQISTGVILNAKPSIELFGNLFFNNSPLHDGAVIMRDGMILAASCFLPKPEKEEHIARQLGSRHRAAIGMSENSDAIIVIVSEETGTISVAEDGLITRGYTKETLSQYLRSKLIPEKPDEMKDKKPKFWKVMKK